MYANENARALAQKIENGTAKVGIIGLGYVGLPLALAFAEDGLSVLGFDVDQRKIDAIEAGECYIDHLDGGRIKIATESGRFGATTDFGRLGEPDAILICVPTPLTRQREPDMRYVENAAREIQPCLRTGQVVILESTTYPGTTDGLLRDVLEESGLRCGEDFFLAFSPEREDPGNPDYGTTTIPKVLGGVDETSGDLAEALYSRAIESTVKVSSARAAEASKLTENIFRAVNIALVNELKIVYDAMDIDVWEVLDAAETKPFGFMRFNPGPGWGGHCIPLDPFYLAWKAREFGQPTRFIELAGEVNVDMPEFVLHKLNLALNDHNKPVRGSRVLVLGLAYKKDISDPRESPAFEIIDGLLKLGAEVEYHDPHVPQAPKMRTWPDLPAMRSVELTSDQLKSADAVLIVTDHSDVDYDAVLENAHLIIDTRGIYRGENEKVVKA
ncbi:MAG: nucleotide sugar dehydrogenase [bacterium]|nr:nucleotide sugar dehydrogenase [bacterium]